MDVQIILSTIRRNKFGAILICIQMAITLAVLCNAIFVIQQRIALIQRPTGTDEENLFTVQNEWIDDIEQSASRTSKDLATLRGLSSIEGAYASNSYPLMGEGDSGSVKLTPDQRYPSAFTAHYFADEETVHTLGVKLVAGRNIVASEVADIGPEAFMRTNIGVIITAPLARQLFPHESAVGKAMYIGTPSPVTIIGVVERLQAPWNHASGLGSTFTENSLLTPMRYGAQTSTYVLHARPGQLAKAIQEVQRVLLDLDRSRVLKIVRSMRDSRREAYRDDRAFVFVLSAVCIVMVLVTAFGIIGLTSHWVTQRRRQIGIRRALGGTRAAILYYFLSENLLIAISATVIGTALTLTINLWAVSHSEMTRLPYLYIAIGAIIIVLLGQIAALWPALRASLTPPALAARSN